MGEVGSSAWKELEGAFHADEQVLNYKQIQESEDTSWELAYPHEARSAMFSEALVSEAAGDKLAPEHRRVLSAALDAVLEPPAWMAYGWRALFIDMIPVEGVRRALDVVKQLTGE